MKIHIDRIMGSRLQLVFGCVLIFFAFASFAFPQEGGNKDSRDVLEVKITADKREYAQGERIPIHVQLTNVGTRSVYIGRDMWTNASPSRVTLSVTPADGHVMAAIQGAVDGLSPGAFQRLPKAAVDWCLSLAPGYSYSSSTAIQEFVAQSGLVPGIYKVRATFVSSGIDANVYFNPLLGHPQELSAFLAEDWKGRIASNEIAFTIVASNSTRSRGKSKK